MNTPEILTAIDQEISRLEQARTLLQGSNEPLTPVIEGKRRGRPPGKATKAPVTNLAPVKTTAPGKQARRTMSADGRARIAAAQKARWAAKKADTKAARAAASAPVAKSSTAAAKQAPVKKAAAAVKTAAAKKTAVPAKAAASKKAAVAATPTSAKKVAAKKAAPAAKKVAAKKAAPAKAAPKKRAAGTFSKPTAEVKAEKPLAAEATMNAAPPEVTVGA